MDQQWSGARSNRHNPRRRVRRGATANRTTGAKSTCHRQTAQCITSMSSYASTVGQEIIRYTLIIDEVGYISFDHDATNPFFQLIAAGYENRQTNN